MKSGFTSCDVKQVPAKYFFYTFGFIFWLFCSKKKSKGEKELQLKVAQRKAEAKRQYYFGLNYIICCCELEGDEAV